ncbi:MAG: 5,10-methylenetetrahydromethanopterin reductase [Mycobacterium sp.]|nr:5,10-methylenetetrahydromethanopterin reductase [Mycobacterium sp.]
MLVLRENLGVLLASELAAGLVGPEGLRLDSLNGQQWLGFPRSNSPAWHDELTAILRSHGIDLGPPPPEDQLLIAAVKLAAVGAGRSLAGETVEHEGAQAAGRDPGDVAVIEYIRICVDDDVDAARRAYTKALTGYALAWPGTNKALGYRGQFGRMGFDEALTELEDRRERGASEDELIDAFPEELAKLVGYFGPASGAAAAFRHLAEGLDTAIVRVVATRPGLESITAVMEACQPSKLPP